MRRPVLIAGPTAGGKSALALELARRDGGTVVNADALQVYDGWRILTARPGPEDVRRVPHRLYGHVAMDARYSVGHWLRDIAAVLDDLASRGSRPVIVGGTGLYLSALTEGLAAVPDVPPEVRARADALIDSRGIGAMRDRLCAEDPATYDRIDRNNPARVQRAWEVLEATGVGLAEWQRRGRSPVIDPEAAVGLVLRPDTPWLNARLSARFDAMLAAGALDECRRVRAAGWDPARPSSKALGAAELVEHLEGRMSLAEARNRAILATRRFAKRQRTWFRSRMGSWPSVDPAAGAAAMLSAVPRE